MKALCSFYKFHGCRTQCLWPMNPFYTKYHLVDICKQCRQSLDATKCGILSWSTLFTYKNFYAKHRKSENIHQKFWKLEMVSSKWLKKPTGQKRVNIFSSKSPVLNIIKIIQNLVAYSYCVLQLLYVFTYKIIV